MAATKKKKDTNEQGTVLKRIRELRTRCVAERVYMRTSDFDGKPLHAYHANNSDSIDELIANCEPTDENQGYGGVFEIMNGDKRYEAANTKPMVEYIKQELGDKAGKHMAMEDVAKPANISCHLLRHPTTENVHVFFLPSDTYLRRLKEEMDGQQ